MRSASLVLVAVASASCSSAELRWVTPPDLEGARGLVAVVHAASGPRAFAVDLDVGEDWSIREEVSADDALAIDLLVYRCPLDSWIAGAKDLSVAESGGRPLPPASAVYSATQQDDFDWASGAQVPERTSSLRFEYADHQRCSELEIEARVPLNSEEEPRLLVPLDAERALVGTEDGAMFVVSRDGALAAFHPGASVDGDPYVAGFTTDDGTIYLMSTGRSCLARADDETTLSRIACLPLGIQSATGTWYDVDGEMTDAGLTVLARTHNGRVFAMTATTSAFRELEFGGASGADSKAGLVWAGDGRGFVSGLVPRDMLAYAGGQLRSESVTLLPFDLVNGVALGREHGPVMVSNFGEVFARAEDGRWVRHGACGVAEARIVAEAGGRVWCGGMGLIAEVGRDEDACNAEITLVGSVRRLASLGGNRLVLSAHVEGQAEVQFLRVTEPYASVCSELDPR